MLTLRNDTPEALRAAEYTLDSAEVLIGQARAMQIRALATLESAQIPTRDGARSLIDWTAARLDLSHETAGSIVGAMRAFEQYPSSLTALAEGRSASTVQSPRRAWWQPGPASPPSNVVPQPISPACSAWPRNAGM